MTGAFIILAITAAVGFILWLHDRHVRKRTAKTIPETPAAEEEISRDDASTTSAAPPPSTSHGPGCCGLHAVCEKYPPSPDKPVYYDDYELDRFRGRDENGYSDEETEEIRDVMLTLLPEDVQGWALSIRQRGITLPASIQQELNLLLLENT